MPAHSLQDRLVVAATVLAESAWLFALLGLVGVALAQDGSPLSLSAVLALVGISALTARLLQMVLMPVRLSYAIQLAMGVGVIVVAVGAQVDPAAGMDLGWIATVVRGTDVEGYTFRASTGSILGAALWWRGGMIAASEFPVESLSTSFRLGILVIAVVAVLDVLHPADLQVFTSMILFFTAGLGGLGAGRLLPASRRAIEERAWLKVIGGLVLGIVIVGLLVSMLQRDVLQYITRPALVVLNLLGIVVFYVIIVPIAFVVGALTQGLLTVLGWFATEEVTTEAPDIGGTLLELQEQTGEVNEVVAVVVQLSQWALVGLLVASALFVIARAFRRRLSWRLVQEEGTRESVKEGADAGDDLRRLLLNLVPRRFRRTRHDAGLRLPDDEADVVDVFRVYFGLLELAREQGFPRPEHATPQEYQHTLEQVLPRSLVRSATAAFTNACYGHRAPPRAQLDELKAQLEQLPR